MNKRRSESFNRSTVYLGHPFATFPPTNMIKINQHTTKLSKALFTAGLLGGAALSSLGAGSAQAAWDRVGNGYMCTFGALMGFSECQTGIWTPTTVPVPLSNAAPVTPPSTFPPSYPAYSCATMTSYPCDKELKLLDWSSIPGAAAAGGSGTVIDPINIPSTLEFTWMGFSDPHPWHVDVDLAGTMQDTNGGFLGYTMKVTDPNWLLEDAALYGIIPVGTVTKDIYSSAALYNSGNGGVGDLCSLTSNGSPQECNYLPVSQIWVRDKWANTATVDSFANDFSQEVPAPLPLLGAGAAFGSIRKLRKFSTQLKTFSMN